MQLEKITEKVVMLTILFTSITTLGQAQWKMQPIVLKTRWAKDVSPKNTHQEYPRPNLRRNNWINLNGLWDYVITGKDAACPANFEDKILVPYPIESALSGVKKPLLPTQNLWYKRTISKPLLKSGERLILNFGAVDWQATVFVNGKEVGGHTGGYTAFSLDITDALTKESNELVVKVYDPSDFGIGPHGKQVLYPANIYYTASSGIWQTVWLEVVPAVHVEKLIMTPDIDKGVLNLAVKGTQGKYSVQVYNHGKEIASIPYNEVGRSIAIKIPNAKFWSPETPHLYDLKITLGKDTVKSYFGMRKVGIAKDEKGIERIFLNNKPYYNLGTLDQGFWPEGLYTSPTDEALAFDIKAIKAMGFNTIRKHIKVEPAAWYYHADKIGMLVWQDMVNPNQILPKGSKEEFEGESKEIVEQLHNYPSITTWVLFNEKWGQYDQERLTKWLKDADPGRIVNGHSGEYLYVNEELRSPSANAYVGADLTDVHSYPNPMLPIKQDGKAQVCGEFGGIGVPVPDHQWDELKGWGYIQVLPKELVGKYEIMVKRLMKMKSEGLSGSIYTQPFDVEGEENGLMTYDREVIKIPLKKLREIHGELISLTAKGFELDRKFNIGKPIDLDDTDDKYQALLAKFEAGNRDSATLRRIILIAIRKQDQPAVTKVGNAFITGLQDKFKEENLLFINKITRTSNDLGFELFLKDSVKVNAVLGANNAELKIMSIIYKEEIKPYDEAEQPAWDKIESYVKTKYGALGEERVWGSKVAFYLVKADWEQFNKYSLLYLNKFLASNRTFLNINSVAWQAFLHSSDIRVLNVATRSLEKLISQDPNTAPNIIDTYANLLFKIGKKDEAVEWEQKAVEKAPEDPSFKETLDKMRKGIKTWVVDK